MAYAAGRGGQLAFGAAHEEDMVHARALHIPPISYEQDPSCLAIRRQVAGKPNAVASVRFL